MFNAIYNIELFDSTLCTVYNTNVKLFGRGWRRLSFNQKLGEQKYLPISTVLTAYRIRDDCMRPKLMTVSDGIIIEVLIRKSTVDEELHGCNIQLQIYSALRC